MKTIENTTVYKCEYCKKHSIFKNVITRHEKGCSNNPKNRHKCFECRFLKKEISYDKKGYKTTSFLCLYKGVNLRSYKTELSTRLREYYNGIKLMPNECVLFEYGECELTIEEALL